MLTSDSLQPWPIVERFLQNIPDGAVGIDVGCGNGKYLSVNPNVYIIASDRYVKARKAVASPRKFLTLSSMLTTIISPSSCSSSDLLNFRR